MSRKRLGLDGLGLGMPSWGDSKYVGSFAAGSGVYVSPTGELIVNVSRHFTDDLRPVPAAGSLVRANSPTLRPTASVNGPFAVDEGSAVQLTGQGKPPITKAFVQLFSDTGVGVSHDDSAWLNVEYEDRDLDHFDDLCRLNLGNNSVFDPCGDVVPDPLADRVSSVRWFAPPGCNIQANDYPVRSDEFPGPARSSCAGRGSSRRSTTSRSCASPGPPAGTLPAVAGVTAAAG